MILNNFKLYSLLALSASQENKGNNLFFTTWDGEIRHIWDNEGNYAAYEGHYQSCHHLFTGGQISKPDWITGIMDFQTEEEMVASKKFYNCGSRTSTRTAIVSDPYGVNKGTSGMIILGSGDTPPTKEDYKLDSWIPTANLRMETASISLPISNLNENTTPPDRIGTFLTTFRNVTLSNITVKEIGLVVPFGSQEANTLFVSKILLVRDVLESPVIIKPGELYTFSLTIK
jgi:hypothetical protein